MAKMVSQKTHAALYPPHPLDVCPTLSATFTAEHHLPMRLDVRIPRLTALTRDVNTDVTRTLTDRV